LSIIAPFDLSGWALLWMAAAVLGAAYIRGYSGFGFSALVVSASALVTNPLNLVPVVMLLEIVATAGQARNAWANLEVRTLLLLLAGASIAMPVSIYLLSSLDVNLLRLVISAWILIMCACILSGWSLKAHVGTASTFGAGLVSGLANAAAVGGLPVALFLAARNLPAAVFRATMIFYLCAIDMVALPIFGFNGLITRDTFIAAIICVPLLGLGVWLGGRKFISAAPENFRRMAIGLLAFLAVMGLVKSLV
jgi:uncharacterized membrane protein YfcA